jgi:TonB-dependent starch-binding outer membrane protein SusC
VLVISSIGFAQKEIIISIDNNIDSIILNISESKLDEIQIIAYGTTTKRLATGNVGSITAKEIEKQPINNPLLAIQGRVPGVFITQSTGLSGSGVQVLIQGQNSLNRGNDPFYVVDGVPYVSQLLPNLGDILGNSRSAGLSPTNNGNPLSFLSPSDIESIDILKDADATAIYGSRAANGAILITTKKGKAGQSKIDLSVQQGWGRIDQRVALLKTADYLEMRHEAKFNDNTPIAATDYDINGLWDSTRYTNWQNELIGGTAKYNDFQGSISGGTGNTTFLIGGNFHKESTVYRGNFYDAKISTHFSISNTSPNGKFKAALSGSYLNDNNKLPSSDPTSNSILLAPNAPSLYNSDGTINWMPNASGRSSWDNPMALTLKNYKVKANNLIANANMGYEVIPGLQVYGSFGFTALGTEELITNPLESRRPENRATVQRSTVFGNNTINTWVIEPQISYRRQVYKGKIDLLVGSTIQKNVSYGSQLLGRGFNSDLLLEDIKSASTILIVSTTSSQYKYNAIFGRLNYIVADKYIVNFSARRDGSSRFGPENLFHNFGALGAAWIFSNEGFIKDRLQFLSYGKVRSSYGTTGNDQIGDYQYLNNYEVVNPGLPYDGATGLTPLGIANPYLQWENTEKFNIGIDLGFLKDRFIFGLNYYRNRSSNQLLGYQLPITTGVQYIVTNFPATIQNKGVEISINSTNYKGAKFTWTTFVNITVPENKLIKFSDLATSSYANDYEIGKPISNNRVYHLVGIEPNTGTFQFEDKSGNLTDNPDPTFDRLVQVNTAPKLYGGLGNSINFKSWQLDFLFQYVVQKGQNYSFGNLPGAPGVNQPIYVLNRWQREGDVQKNNQRFNSDYSISSTFSSANTSDGTWKDASFIRLKNVSLLWEVPRKMKTKMHLSTCSIFIQGQNLLRFTKFQGMDPETRSISSLPPLRLLSMGLKVSF